MEGRCAGGAGGLCAGVNGGEGGGGTLTRHAVQSASPVLLTKSGPLGTRIQSRRCSEVRSSVMWEGGY